MCQKFHIILAKWENIICTFLTRTTTNLPPATSDEVTLALCPERVFTGLKSRANQIWQVLHTKDKLIS